MRICIVSEVASARLAYVAHILSLVSGHEVVALPKGENRLDDLLIGYGVDDYPLTLDNGLGQCMDLAPYPTDDSAIWDMLEEVNGLNVDAALPKHIDLPSLIFTITTAQRLYGFPHLDKHGRVDYLHDPYYSKGLYKTPLVHKLGTLFLNMVRSKYQISKPPIRKFSYKVTVDVDRPARYIGRRFGMPLLALFSDLSKLKFARAKDRALCTLGMKEDPYLTFEMISRVAGKEATIFFLLLDKNGHNHSLPKYFREKYLIRLWKKLSTLGEVGIHPGYDASTSIKLMKEEFDQFIGVMGVPPNKSRMHFLKISLPNTYKQLIDLGIRDDYTTISLPGPGFAHGMAIPFPWYNVDNEEQTRLTLHPTMVMDRSLLDYANLSPQEALVQCLSCLEHTKNLCGEFTILIHNDALSDIEEWKGWEETWIELINRCKHAKDEAN